MLCIRLFLHVHENSRTKEINRYNNINSVCADNAAKIYGGSFENPEESFPGIRPVSPGVKKLSTLT